MFPAAPPGSTPNSVSLSPDEKRLPVANADNNTVAVIDVSESGRSQVDGFIPTGWYPTAAMISRDGSQLFVLSGKGMTSSPNPRSMPRSIPGGEMQYVGAMLTGTLSFLPNPGPSQLQTLTRWRAARRHTRTNTGWSRRARPAPRPFAARRRPSPIRHVFYVIANRT